MSSLKPTPNSPLAGKRFLVTGGTGFFGRRLIEDLLRANAEYIRVYDVAPLNAKKFRNDIKELFDERVEAIQGDVRDKEKVLEAVKGMDCVFHIASFGMSGTEMMNAPLVHSINVGGTQAVIEACKKNQVSSLIYTSTNNVLFDGKTPLENVDETYPYPPAEAYMDPYSHSKAEAEKIIIQSNGDDVLKCTGARSKRKKLSTCSMRCAGIYGEGEERHFPRIAWLIDLGFAYCKFGDPATKCDWVYVDNLVHAHLLAAENILAKGNKGVASGECYFVSDGEPMNQFEFLRPLYEGYAGRFPPLTMPDSIMNLGGAICEFFHHVMKPIKPFQPILTRMEVAKITCTHYFSIEKIRKQLGYEPLVPFKVGIHRTVEGVIAAKQLEKKSLKKPRFNKFNILLVILIAVFVWCFFQDYFSFFPSWSHSPSLVDLA